jgi:hypothetical protein
METFAKIDLIVVIALVTVLGWLCALLSYFLDYCFWERSIFQNYLPWLASKCISREDLKEVSMLRPSEQANDLIRRASGSFFYKVLGGCIICTNVWLSFITFFILCNVLNLGWYYVFIYTITSSYFLRRITTSPI